MLALAPALIGMALGQWVRARVRPETFRICFFAGSLLLGAHLVFACLDLRIDGAPGRCPMRERRPPASVPRRVPGSRHITWRCHSRDLPVMAGRRMRIRPLIRRTSPCTSFAAADGKSRNASPRPSTCSSTAAPSWPRAGARRAGAVAPQVGARPARQRPAGPDQGPLSGQAQRQIHARPAGHRREDQHQLQQFLRVRLRARTIAKRGAGAQAAAVDGQDRRHGGEGAGDRHRRSHPQDAAGGAALSPPLRRGLVDGDPVDRLSARQAGRAGQAAVVGEIRADGDLPRSRRSRPARSRPGIRGPMSRA